MSIKKDSGKASLKNGTRTDEPVVLKLNKVGKIKRKDIRKAVLAVRQRKAVAGR
jgi:hypothetical protein